jgi:short-subunit dehydrogenase
MAYNMKNIKNYIVVIAGATGGIGSSIITSLTGKVATIICLNRKYETQFVSKKTTIKFIKTDLDSLEDWNKAIKHILEEHKRIDLFVNCIGEIITGDLNNQTIKDIEHIISVNLMIHIYGLKSILPVMLHQKSGHIIEVGSLGSLIPMPFVSTYSATKFALRGLVLSLREELKNTGVTISLLNPGPVDTNMLKEESEDPRALISFADKAISTVTVAKSVRYLLDHPKIEMTIPVRSRFYGSIVNQLPNLFNWIYPFINYLGSKRRITYRHNLSGELL